jgi:hypothetical protein
MRKMCTIITNKGKDIDENIANQMLPVHVHRNRGILTSLISVNTRMRYGKEFSIIIDYMRYLKLLNYYIFTCAHK